VFDKPDMESFMAWAPNMTLDGVVERITQPFLITHGAHDRQIPLEAAHRSYDQAINSAKRTLRIFTEQDGGVEHCAADNQSPTRNFIADWVSGGGADFDRAFSDLAPDEPGVDDIARPDADVISLADDVDDTIGKIQGDRNSWILFRELADDRCNEPFAHGDRAGHAQKALGLARAVNLGQKLITLLYDPAALIDKGPPGVGEAHSARRPVEELGTEPILKASDDLADIGC
jgi:hypothetical protein